MKFLNFYKKNCFYFKNKISLHNGYTLDIPIYLVNIIYPKVLKRLQSKRATLERVSSCSTFTFGFHINGQGCHALILIYGHLIYISNSSLT